MKKKTLSLILALLMVFSLLPASAFAANTVQSGTCGENLTWTLDDEGVLTITGTNLMSNAPWSTYKDSIKSVVIGEGVMSVCDNAFYECTNLEEVSLPKGLDTIGSSAFRGCSSLEKINIPASVTYISDRAFCDCSKIKEITLPNKIIYLSDLTFYGCSSLTSITIPERVAHTGSAVFTKCTSLKNVVINGTMQTLEYSMFAGCSALESVSLPKSLKSINTGAFADCTSLKNVYFGGTEMQWYTIEIQENNDALDSANVYFALDYPFTDIADSGYREYISLGQAVGIVNGYPDGTFRPNQPVTRAQMAAFSYRLMKLIVGSEPDAKYKVDCGFKDSASIAKDYKEAVNVMANLGIITGFDTDNDGVGDTFRPNATANRGQAATIIVRVAASLGGSE